MARAIERGIDKLFVEGTDDQAVVNALVKRATGVDVAEIKLVQTQGAAGAAWALGEFARYAAEARTGTRIGVIVDRDGIDGRPDTALLYAREACRLAKDVHGAEYDAAHARKAMLKVRGVWRDATTAAGYGHLVRALPLTETPASSAFLAWFTTLFLS